VISNFYLFALTRTVIESLQVNYFCSTGKQKEWFPLTSYEGDITVFTVIP